MNVNAVLDFALRQVGAAYLYGAADRPCLPAYRLEKARQYPAYASSIKRHCPALSGKTEGCAGCRFRGRPAYDCAQLVKKALLQAGLRLPSGASSQWKAGEAWALKLPYSPAIAARHACVLFRKDEDGEPRRPMAHVGLSLGDGTAVDARNHQSGVIRSKLSAYPWTDLAFPKGFPLPQGLPVPATNPVNPVPVPADTAALMRGLKHGAQGAEARALQNRLLALGYPLPRFGADGMYGRETAGAVRAFQHTAGLAPTGTADEHTLSRLFPKPVESAPADVWDEEDDPEFETD